MTDNTWVKPSPREVIEFVRAVIAENPERHGQKAWIGNLFSTIRELDAKKALEYAFQPVPETPADPEQPYCGTTGCVAGWGVAFASPPGTMLTGNGWANGYYVELPDGTREMTENYARRVMGLNKYQADWLFSEHRTREEVLARLDALLADPDADISGQNVRQFTVKVFDADGTEMGSRDIWAEGDAGTETILYKAYYQE